MDRVDRHVGSKLGSLRFDVSAACGRAGRGAWPRVAAALTLALAFGLSFGAAALEPQSAPMYVPPAPAEVAERAAVAPPLRLAETVGVEPMASLRPALVGALDQLEAMASWNRAGKRPVQVGFARPLPLAQRVRFSPELVHRQSGAVGGGVFARSPTGAVVWGAEVRVEDAYRLRLHLDAVRLPAGARLWVYGAEGEIAGPFGTELMAPGGGLWTPSVAGPVARVEVELPAAELAARPETGFVVDRVGEIVPLGHEGVPGVITATQDTTCLIDATCVSGPFVPAPVNDFLIPLVQRAVAQLLFASGPGFFICSGGLLNTAPDFTGDPLLLTANHCIGNQAEASSLEATWDFNSSTCNGPAPAFSSPGFGALPKSSGATLLTTGVPSDFTLLRLNSLPDAQRVFLGWMDDTSGITTSQDLHRVHHPAPGGSPLPQKYSRTRRIDNFLLCGFDGAGRNLESTDDFLHLRLQQGGEFGGTSGGPLVTDVGQVVGQNFGACGPDPNEGCDPANDILDGNFQASFPAMAPFLAPQQVDTSPCVSNATTLCLNNNRFEVKVVWVTPIPTSGAGQREVLTSDTGYFWFFDQANVEVVIKVLDACSFTNRFWVFAGGLTNVNVVITVRDTQTGQINTYTNPLNTPFQPVQDTNAFATCP